ncbi:hypothetical protein BDP27DRAFT_1310061 [Rhodocollybia butyracea]|uniref:Histone chaperone RTT106/FACT complex subunit SPT16-like middle domain-containing protein n=1 Tax=Rhodocollybia butyracea TaxID=206335 RepID=A0A9P5UGS2_9AGAR|nr:hypothetical protein BDP27DRAFT_1310061 [Rhodocollybia butyracea]
MSSQTPFLHVVSATLPESLSKELDALCSSSSSEVLLDNLIRFVCGAECTSTDEALWASQQNLVQQKLGNLLSTSSKKRPRDAAASDSDSNKKQKLSTSSQLNEPELEDLGSPIFTLQSISVTSPIRKKVNIIIYPSALRFVNSASQTIEATLPLSSLHRAFLLPTRGKQRPHWTVVIMSGDAPDKGGSGKGSKASGNDQIIFGLDAIASGAISATGEKSWSLKKGDETLPLIQAFLSLLADSLPKNHLPIFQLSVEPINKFDRLQSHPDGVRNVPSLAISANLAAKPGTLWFMPSGILWGESKPCMFWSVADLANGEGVEGVRTISATGRVCTVILTRKLTADSSLENDNEEEEIEETAFGQIEGKEQEEINQWVRKYRHLFGLKEGSSAPTKSAASSSKPQPSSAGPLTINQMISKMASDDDKDGDGEADTSDSGSGLDDEDEGDEDAEADSDNEDEEGDGSLDPRHHPLLRPGAMPKMSKTAMDMVVGMVEEDLVGGGQLDQEDELDG